MAFQGSHERSSSPLTQLDEDTNNTKYKYFIDYFDLDARMEILGLAAEFGAEAEDYIFMLRRPIEEGASSEHYG